MKTHKITYQTKAWKEVSVTIELPDNNITDEVTEAVRLVHGPLLINARTNYPCFTWFVDGVEFGGG